MKLILISLFTLLFGVAAYFFYLGYKSQKGTPPGLLPDLSNSKLTPCSNKPNCICTEYPDAPSHYTEAILYDEKTPETIVQSIRTAITETGGQLFNANTINKNSTYISATYTSSLFKFVDDFEVRIDRNNKRIHIRSASRVGHSDMGANLKRIKAFRKKLPQ